MLKKGDKVKIKGLRVRGTVAGIEKNHPVYKLAYHIEIEGGFFTWCLPAQGIEKVTE